MKYIKLIAFEQTLLGLPWALIGAILPFANPSFVAHFSHISLWFWILVAFTGARTAGMSFNRLYDCDMDKLNPRTKDRPLPAGKITKKETAALAWISLFVFIGACAMINELCLFFSPLVAFLIWAYSFTKRFTPLCHFVLGLIEFFAPFLGWMATAGTFTITPVFLGLSTLLWISGMDIAYAIQDITFDRQMRLNSIPAKLGEAKSLLLAKILHGASVLFLALAGFSADVSVIYYIGLACVSALFIYQHRTIKPQDMKVVPSSFFVTNSLIGVTQFTFTLVGILWIGS